jgi:hypothetical protein
MAITPIGSGVSTEGIYFEEQMLPMNLHADIVAADVGKAVAIDTSANAMVKLAGDNDVVVGRLETWENRVQEGIKVGTVAFGGALRLPVKSGETVVRGGSVQGAGAGEVKPLAAQTDTDGTGTPTIKNASHDFSNLVLEVHTGYCIVLFK